MSWSANWDAGRISGPDWPAAKPTTDRARGDRTTPQPAEAGSRSFRDALQTHLQQPLRWSRHAEQRLRSAGVDLQPDDMRSILGAVDSLAERGTRDALVVYGQLALIVSVSNRTVVTAATPERWQDGIFTQIDGAAVVQKHDESGAGPHAGGAPGPWSDGSGPEPGRFTGL